MGAKKTKLLVGMVLVQPGTKLARIGLVVNLDLP
jgi:hypothetical protein